MIENKTIEKEPLDVYVKKKKQSGNERIPCWTHFPMILHPVSAWRHNYATRSLETRSDSV